ncbi:GMP synthase [glutamine-hydrolyzing] [Rickettsiales bacterium]|nr:GMP synthase [glutamine-hydrolyzing] [Rickettsiales bacterium]
MKTPQIILIDFGSQLTQLIARRIREANVYSEIVPGKDKFINKIASAKALILSGGPDSVNSAPILTQELSKLKIPILAICYGLQLVCKESGGEVYVAEQKEFGAATLEVVNNCLLTEDIWQIGSKKQVWMSHNDKVTRIPPGFKVLAKTQNSPFAAIYNEESKIYGLQFHPEVTHTTDGNKIINNFIFKIAGCQKDWKIPSLLTQKVEEIKSKAGDSKVIAAISGGVDSAVAATLAHKAIGKNLHCIFIDNGLLRAAEVSEVKNQLVDKLGLQVKFINANNKFLQSLANNPDPEQKRKIIGRCFIEAFEEEASRIEDAKFLLQGTIYPDVIESGSVFSEQSVTIKSHHNVGGLPEKMTLGLIEPLRCFFKDEVRMLGKTLGIPEEILNRHPFPGPGLAIRIIGPVTAEKVEILQAIDQIYIDAIKNAGLYDQIWQAFAVLLPIQTVGVMGDRRSYEYTCALRAVTSEDGMTADYFQFSPELLQEISNKIVNNIPRVNRVVYDITAKPPATIEWE